MRYNKEVHKNVSTGLIILVNDPEQGPIALLSKRAAFDFERLENAIFPGLCQLTVVAPVSRGQTILAALLVEAENALGQLAHRFIKRYLDKMQTVTEIENEKQRVFVHALKLPHSFLAMLKPGRSIEKFVLVAADKLSEIKLATKEHREQSPAKGIHMFPDGKQALERAFIILAGIN